MRKTKLCSLIMALAIIFILMLIVNFTVLRVYFDVRLSDLALLWKGDGSAVGDGSVEGDGSAIGDGSAVGDGSTEGDGSVEGDGSTEGDGSAVGDSSAEGDGSPNGEFTIAGVREMLNKLSFMDKAALGLILTKISRDDLQRIYSTFDGGVTTEELQSIIEYAGNALEPYDMEKLKEIFDRNKHLYTEASSNKLLIDGE